MASLGSMPGVLDSARQADGRVEIVQIDRLGGRLRLEM
jgi:hypothetical protein